MTALSPSSIDLEALQKSESESLLASLITQRARLSVMAQQCLENGLPAVAVRIEAAITTNLELVAKLLGQIVHHSQITTKSFLVTPSYLRVRSALIRVLKPHPEIACEVARALAAIEHDEANEITAKANKPPLIEHQAVSP